MGNTLDIYTTFYLKELKQPLHRLPKHMPALDGLRGDAILLVIFTHTSVGWVAADSIVRDTSGGTAKLVLPHWLELIASNAAHGVMLFFVISAFTLTLSVLAHPLDLKQFATRRIARVGPGYWLAGIGYTLVASASPRLWAPSGVSPYDFAVAAVFGSAWQGGASFAVVPGRWSVSGEMTFYLLLPLFVMVIGERLWRAVALTALALLVAQLRTRHDFALGVWSIAEYCNPLIQTPVFLFGISAAMLVRRLQIPPLPGVAVLTLLVAVIAVPFTPIADRHVLTSVQFALVAVVAVAVSALQPPWPLTNGLMRRLGEVSYSMYLVHFAVMPLSLLVSGYVFPGSDWKAFVLHFGPTATVAFIISCITYRWIEQPFIKWAHRARPSLRQPVNGSAAAIIAANHPCATTQELGRALLSDSDPFEHEA